MVLFTQGQFPSFRLDWRWRFLASNAAFLRLANVTLSALLGVSCWTAVPQLRGSAAGDLMRRGMRTRRIQTGRVSSAFAPGRMTVVTVGPAGDGIEVVGSLLATE